MGRRPTSRRIDEPSQVREGETPPARICSHAHEWHPASPVKRGRKDSTNCLTNTGPLGWGRRNSDENPVVYRPGSQLSAALRGMRIAAPM